MIVYVVVGCAIAGVEGVLLGFLGAVVRGRREQRRLEELTYGVRGRAFTEEDRAAATSRLRP